MVGWILTPGSGARITGALLKFDQKDPNQGVFFVNIEDGSATRVETTMLKNKPSELIFMNPLLDPGTYYLEVRSILTGNTKIRTGRLSAQVTAV
ncbi:MAG: DUF4469 domain-containing protein [Balneolaceae bacterium]|nr:DUF4469 domain-containing protein [Balneolaceae bacterium]